MWHDKNILKRDFHIGQEVLLFNFKLKLFSGKLRLRWSRHFEIIKISPFRAIEVTHPTNVTLKVNGQKLKPYVDRSYGKLKASTPLSNPH